MKLGDVVTAERGPGPPAGRRMTVKRTMMWGGPTSPEEGHTVRSAEKEMRIQEESCSGQEAQWGLWLEPETRRT